MRRFFGQRLRASVGTAVFLAIASMPAACQAGTNQAGAAQSSSNQSTVVLSPSNQSLGDIARENRTKKGEPASSTAPTKVITNADLPKNPDGYSEPPVNSEAATGSNQKPGRSAGARKAAGASRLVNPQVAAMWRGRILAQKAIIANLQGQIDEMRAGMDYLNPGRGDPGANGSAVAFSPSEARRAARLRQMELRFAQLKQRLEETQDAARQAGMDSKVYDP